MCVNGFGTLGIFCLPRPSHLLKHMIVLPHPHPVIICIATHPVSVLSALSYSRNKGRCWNWFPRFSLTIGCASDIIRFIFPSAIREQLLNGLENYEIQNKAIRISAGREPRGSVCTWVCERRVPRMRLRTIILQQSLCLISYSSDSCGERQFPRWPQSTIACFSPTLPGSDRSADRVRAPLAQVPRSCFLQAKASTQNTVECDHLSVSPRNWWPQLGAPVVFSWVFSFPPKILLLSAHPFFTLKEQHLFLIWFWDFSDFWDGSVSLSNSVFLFKHRIVFKLTNGVTVTVFWEWKCG